MKPKQPNTRSAAAEPDSFAFDTTDMLRQRAQLEAALARMEQGQPATPPGYAQSSLNAFRHGLTGAKIQMAADDLPFYLQHSLAFVEDLRPVGVREASLVQHIIDAEWRLGQASALELDLIAEARFGSGPHDCGPEQTARATLTLNRTGLYQSRLRKDVIATTKELERLQDRRIAREGSDAYDAAECPFGDWYRMMLERVEAMRAAQRKEARRSRDANHSKQTPEPHDPFSDPHPLAPSAAAPQAPPETPEDR